MQAERAFHLGNPMITVFPLQYLDQIRPRSGGLLFDLSQYTVLIAQVLTLSLSRLPLPPHTLSWSHRPTHHLAHLQSTPPLVNRNWFTDQVWATIISSLYVTPLKLQLRNSRRLCRHLVGCMFGILPLLYRTLELCMRCQLY